MKILVLDGNPRYDDRPYEKYLVELIQALEASGHRVKRVLLRTKKINFCKGCWSCWVKTPGLCLLEDDSWEICKKVINADFVLICSPVIMGFTSALLKKTQDKLISLVHPYVEIVDGECHHKKRYEKYPKLGLLLAKSKDTDDEDVAIISGIFQRFALNFRTSLCFTKLTTQTVREVGREIDNI